MKKNKKGILFIILLTICLICPLNTTVKAEQSNYLSVQETESVSFSNISFTNLTFKDTTNTSAQSFGITGTITTQANSYYTFQVLYYDTNFNMIGNYGNTQFVQKGTHDFSLMTNLSILNGYTVNDIAYYKLTITSLENNQTQYTPSVEANFKAYPYVIDKYDIDIVVNENNTFDITETITAYFNEQRHGIYRKIPLKNKIQRLDGTTSSNRAEITNLTIDNEYSTSKSGGYYQIQIGDEYKTITGSQTYTIKYTYNIGKDPIKNYDELYYNLIGNEWDTVIGGITFNITMPKEFDSSKLGFSSGLKGSLDNSKITYNVNGNQISGRYNGILSPEEALTVRCELPEGYFVGAQNVTDITDYLIFIVPIACLLVSIILWFIFGRDKKTVNTVEFYPPEGFNSLEIGYLYKGKATNKDVTSLLVYLADKGYIKLTETNEKSLFSKVKGFKITKLKEYDGNNYNEKAFLDGLFKQNNISQIISQITNTTLQTEKVEEVTLTDLYNSFYLTVNDILNNINTKENKEKIFEKNSLNKKAIIIIMLLITYILITVIPILNYGEPSLIPFAILFPAVGFSVLFGTLFGKTGIGLKIFGFIWGSIFGGVPFCNFVLPAVSQDSVYIAGYLIGIICLIGMFICFKFIPKRTSYGNEILGKIKGFKHFLEIAKKEELEAEVQKNPNYFYDILPYTYVLGVSDKWINKFEGITMEAPDWYSGATFTVATFGTFMNIAMVSASTAMTSHPSSSSSGGSSGGGSSGGGSGGGGGGSW